MSAWELVVFLGPSLRSQDARTLTKGKLLPPAKQGDVYRVLPRRPKAIALIDGLFEAVPSVWHRELLAALDAGVAVFGASSMGALRAAELRNHGVIGVGQVYRWAASGKLGDDADVALLHADAEHDFRPLTVPLVNAWHACETGRKTKRLSVKESRNLRAAAEQLHYQDRTWAAIVEGAALQPERAGIVLQWLKNEAQDLKALDARACIAAAAAFVASGARAPRTQLAVVPSHARSRQLLQTPTVVGEQELGTPELIERLRARPDGEALTDAGMRTLALAAHARTLGVIVPEQELEAEQERLREHLGAPARLALDEGQLRRLAESLCLERFVLHHAQRLFPDGPSELEALALGARLSGAWAEMVDAPRPARRKKR